nr:hypothetical protein [Methylobacterium sp. ZNC0032]
MKHRVASPSALLFEPEQRHFPPLAACLLASIDRERRDDMRENRTRNVVADVSVKRFALQANSALAKPDRID